MRSLRRNNRREWFEAHKPEFERELKQPMLALIETVNRAMEDFAPAHVRPPQKCMMRIYRDIRFSSDKRPYKSHISAWWSREGLEKTSGGGYYMHISPDEVLIAAGVYMPEREQLLAIREIPGVHHAEVRRLLNDRKLRRTMESFTGMPLTRPPKGFPKDHPAMDLLLCRQWGVEATLEPTASLQKDFASESDPALPSRSSAGGSAEYAAGREHREEAAALVWFLGKSGINQRKTHEIGGKSWKNKPKTEQISVFRLTNAGQSRIVNGGGFVFTRINTGFPDDRCKFRTSIRRYRVKRSSRTWILQVRKTRHHGPMK